MIVDFTYDKIPSHMVKEIINMNPIETSNETTT